MPELVVYAFNAILTTAGSPKAAVDQLHTATLKVMADPEFQNFLRQAGAEPVTDSSPDRTTRFLQGRDQALDAGDQKRWTSKSKTQGGDRSVR